MSERERERETEREKEKQRKSNDETARMKTEIIQN